MALVFLAHPGRRHPALLASSRSPTHRNHFAAAAADNGAKVFGPTGEGDGFLLGISGAVINTGNAGTVAANVIKHGLDDMRWNLKIVMHPCGNGAPQIMQAPVGDRTFGGNAGVEPHLVTGPTQITVRPTAEDIVTASKVR